MSMNKKLSARRHALSTNHGFTLLELMIVVAVIAILASIALPSYQEHVRKTRRGAATGCMLEAAQYLERFYTTKLTYEDAIIADAAGARGWDCQNDLDGHYTIELAAADGTTYSIKATPTSNSQRKDKCGVLTLDQVGNRAALKDSTTVAGCW